MSLTIPPLLQQLIETERWRHPGDDALRLAIPLLEDPVDFRAEISGCTVASEIQDYFSASDFEMFKIYRGKESDRPLPWLNADLAVFLAINRIPGDDVAIALDYRAATDNPKVVASHYRDDKYCGWFEVAEDFGAFARLLGLNAV